jgi:peptidoglycan hydrolase-like protein with peptidoglycan-binding domain
MSMKSGAISLVFLALLLLPYSSSAQALCPDLSRNLSFGSRGTDVVSLQNFLILENLFEAGNNTGYFGQLTEAAVIKFQSQQDVPTTGLAGVLTRAAIAKSCVAKEVINLNAIQMTNKTTGVNLTGATGTLPVIISISPSVGPIGTLVTIHGSGFAHGIRNDVYLAPHGYSRSGEYITDGYYPSGVYRVLGTNFESANRGTSLAFTVPDGIPYSRVMQCNICEAGPRFSRQVATGTYDMYVETPGGVSNTVDFTVTGI